MKNAIKNIVRNINLIYSKTTFNDWLGKNTTRNSILTWRYKDKLYNIDEIRTIWENEILN